MASVRTLDRLSTLPQRSAYLYPEILPGEEPSPFDVFFFQYWPQEINDSFDSGWVDKPIPGGDQPIQQYVGGQPHSITFAAVFTAEINDPGIPQLNIPGEKYTIDLVAARQRLESYTRPTYRQGGQLGVTEPPPRIVLVFPGLALGRDRDQLLVVMKSINIVHQRFFPDGRPRIMTVNLTFQESIQFQSKDGQGVRFIGRDRFVRSRDYRASQDPFEAIGGA